MPLRTFSRPQKISVGEVKVKTELHRVSCKKKRLDVSVGWILWHRGQGTFIVLSSKTGFYHCFLLLTHPHHSLCPSFVIPTPSNWIFTAPLIHSQSHLLIKTSLLITAHTSFFPSVHHEQSCDKTVSLPATELLLRCSELQMVASNHLVCSSSESYKNQPGCNTASRWMVVIFRCCCWLFINAAHLLMKQISANINQREKENVKDTDRKTHTHKLTHIQSERERVEMKRTNQPLLDSHPQLQRLLIAWTKEGCWLLALIAKGCAYKSWPSPGPHSSVLLRAHSHAFNNALHHLSLCPR